jgi:hypothetical protein
MRMFKKHVIKDKQETSFKTIVLEKKLTVIAPNFGHAIGTKTKFLPVLDALN